MSKPVIKEEGFDYHYKEVFSDEFEGNSVDSSKWIPETMEDSLHRVGSSGMNDKGEPTEDRSPKYMRWSANYSKPDKCIEVRDGKLVMKGFTELKMNPYRKNYTDAQGRRIMAAKNMHYTGWLTTASWMWSEEHKRHIEDPSTPCLFWGPGHYFEMKVSFENMKVQGHRLSFWLMPGRTSPTNLVMNKAYNDTADDGVEVDVFEYENPEYSGRDVGSLLQIKVIGGAIGNTPNGSFDAKSVGVDLRKGFHTIGILHTKDSLVWFLDGIKVQEDYDRVPQCENYMVISREMNSGVKADRGSPKPEDTIEDGLKLPVDAGLYATNIHLDQDKIGTSEDEAIIDYVKVWKLVSENEADVDEPTPEPVVEEPVSEPVVEKKVEEPAPSTIPEDMERPAPPVVEKSKNKKEKKADKKRKKHNAFMLKVTKKLRRFVNK